MRCSSRSPLEAVTLGRRSGPPLGQPDDTRTRSTRRRSQSSRREIAGHPRLYSPWMTRDHRSSLDGARANLGKRDKLPSLGGVFPRLTHDHPSLTSHCGAAVGEAHCASVSEPSRAGRQAGGQSTALCAQRSAHVHDGNLGYPHAASSDRQPSGAAPRTLGAPDAPDRGVPASRCGTPGVPGNDPVVVAHATCWFAEPRIRNTCANRSGEFASGWRRRRWSLTTVSTALAAR